MIYDASWIGTAEDFGEICPKFRKVFDVSKKLTKAELVITAVGVYEASINNKRVGNFILAPGLTSYKTRLQYQTYDITHMLSDNNEITVTVGTGWYRGHISENSKDINNTPCGLIAEIAVSYEDGEVEHIYTDDTWEVAKSKILMADIYDGVIYNATACDTAYIPVKVLDLPKERLIPQEGEPVCEQERIKPVSYIVTPKGERVIDFGQNLAGYVEFKVHAKKGDKVHISHAEILDNDGNFYTENYRGVKTMIDYTCTDGEQTYKPQHTFYGYRYIRIDEYPGEIELDDFTSIAVYSDMERTGYVQFGNAKLNCLFENTLWSQRSNFLDIPTDCPQRNERMGWTGDAQVFAKTASFNYNVKKFFDKWLADLRAEQRADGSIPDTVPNFWQISRSSTAWGDVICVLPWQMYITYGDIEILKNNFQAMKNWVDYITGDTLDQYLWTSEDEGDALWQKHYGDWLALDAPYGSYRGSTNDDFIASAFYAYSTSLVIKAGTALGEDISGYEELYRNIVKTFKLHFSKLTTQTEHVLALIFGLCDDKKTVADNLVKMIRDNGNKLQTGFVGTPYLLHALSQNGYADVAYDLLLQEEYPSWLYEVNHGATTIWEHWDGIRDDGSLWSSEMNSYNHYAYGSVMDWVYTVAAGIQVEKAGFETMVIAPVPDQRIGSLDVSFKSVHGEIRSSWIYSGGKVKYEIVTPVPTTVIIGKNEYHVNKGTYIFWN